MLKGKGDYMRFSDYNSIYNKVYPRVKPVASKIVTTATTPKDIEKEIEEEVVDNSSVEIVSNPPVDTHEDDTIERAEDGIRTDSESNNE